MKPKLFVKQGQHFTRVANRAKPFQWAVISNEDIAKHGLYIAVRDEARRAFKKVMRIQPNTNSNWQH